MADEPDILNVGVSDDGSLETVVNKAAQSFQDLADKGSSALKSVGDAADATAAEIEEMQARTAASETAQLARIQSIIDNYSNEQSAMQSLAAAQAQADADRSSSIASAIQAQKEYEAELENTKALASQIDAVYSLNSVSPGFRTINATSGAEPVNMVSILESEAQATDGLINANATLNSLTLAEIDQIDELATAFRDDNLQAEIDKMVALSNATDQETASVTALNEQQQQHNNLSQGLSSDANFNLGYGVPGGGIGPAELSDDGSGDGSGGGGGSGGSLFAAAHGIRAASGLASLAGAGGATGAFTGTADILYLTQGLKQIGGIFEGLNQSIADTPNILSGVAEGMTAVGVPMASLLTVAAPVGLALGLVVVGFQAFQATVKDTGTLLGNVADGLKVKFGAEQNDTTAQIQSSLDKAKRDKKAADDEIAAINSSQGGAFAAEQTNGGDALARLKFLLASTTPGFQELGKQLDDATKRSNAAAADIQGYSDALGTSSVAVNDANAAVITSIAANKAQADQFAADDQLATDAVKKKIDKLKEETPTLEANVASLEKQLDIAKQAGVNTDNLSAALDTAKAALSGTTAELQHLADVSLEVAQRTAALADAAKVSQQLVDNQTKFDAADADRKANFQAQQAQQAADFAAKRDQEQTAFEQARQQKTADFLDGVNNVETKATADRLKEQQSYQLSATRAEQDYREKLEDIQRTSKTQLLKDAANLDANAVQNDLTAKQSQTDTLTESYNTAKQRRYEDEQIKLNEITTNANADVAKRTDAFNKQQAQDAANYELKRKTEQDNFDQQQRSTAANFDRSEKQQSDSFKRQQDALTAKLQQDEIDIARSYVIQTAKAISGMFDVQTAVSNGFSNITQNISTSLASVAPSIGNAFAAQIAAAAEAAASAALPIANPASAALNGPTYLQNNGLPTAPPGNLVPSGNIGQQGVGVFGADTGGYVNQGFQFSDPSNTSDISPYAFGNQVYQQIFGFADGGFISPNSTGWVGDELVRAGAGGASVTPAGATEPKRSGKSVTISGDIYLNGQLSTATLKPMMKQLWDQILDEDQ